MKKKFLVDKIWFFVNLSFANVTNVQYFVIGIIIKSSSFFFFLMIFWVIAVKIILFSNTLHCKCNFLFGCFQKLTLWFMFLNNRCREPTIIAIERIHVEFRHPGRMFWKNWHCWCWRGLLTQWSLCCALLADVGSVTVVALKVGAAIASKLRIWAFQISLAMVRSVLECSSTTWFTSSCKRSVVHMRSISHSHGRCTHRVINRKNGESLLQNLKRRVAFLLSSSSIA